MRRILGAIGLVVMLSTHAAAEPGTFVIVTAAVARVVPFEGWPPGILVLRGTTGVVAASDSRGELTIVWDSGILINAGDFLRRNVVEHRVPFRAITFEGYEPPVPNEPAP